MKQSFLGYILSFLSLGMYDNHRIEDANSPVQPQSSGGQSIRQYYWFKDIRGFKAEMDRRRVARLISKYKLKYWDIDGTKILALNKENAYRKFLNLSK